MPPTILNEYIQTSRHKGQVERLSYIKTASINRRRAYHNSRMLLVHEIAPQSEQNRRNMTARELPIQAREPSRQYDPKKSVRPAYRGVSSYHRKPVC